MSIMQLESVRYSYSNRYQTNEALKDVSCNFDQGKIYAIIGKSGSGKSTMLSLMAGLDLPDTGEVLFQGKSTRTMDLDRFRRDEVAMIYVNHSDVEVSGTNRFPGTRWVSSNHSRNTGSAPATHRVDQPFSGVPRGRAREGGERIR